MMDGFDGGRKSDILAKQIKDLLLDTSQERCLQALSTDSHRLSCGCFACVKKTVLKKLLTNLKKNATIALSTNNYYREQLYKQLLYLGNKNHLSVMRTNIRATRW